MGSYSWSTSEGEAILRAVCSVNLHILHLRTARCGRLAAASATPSTTPPWAACAREAPSAPVTTPPLAIYVRRFTLFLF
jgi:hypothetical protein